MWSWKLLRDRFRALRDTGAVHREIDEELSFHLDMKTEENIISSVETELAASQGFAPTRYREVVLTETHYEEFCKRF